MIPFLRLEHNTLTMSQVYVEKPVFAKPYESKTSKETEAEVDFFTTKATRPPIQVNVSRTRKQFGGKYTFADEDADQVR